MFGLLFLLPIFACDFVDEKLRSWSNVTSFNLITDAEGHIAGATLTSDDSKLSFVEMELQTRTDYLGSQVKTSNSHCLLEGIVVSVETKTPLENQVRIKFCGANLTGLLQIDKTTYTLHTTSTGSWIVFTGNDLRPGALTAPEDCVAKDKTSSKLYKASSVKKESNSVYRKTRATSQERSYVEIIMFIAYDYFLVLETVQNAIDKAVELVHFADVYYATIPDINLHLVAVDVIVWTLPQDDPLYEVNDEDLYLDQFMTWHANNLGNLPNHDNAIVVTTKDFGNSSTIGLAYMDTLCDFILSGSWIRDVDELSSMTAGTLAHELGHNFGLDHNPTDPTDPCFCDLTQYCVMDAYAAYQPPQVFTDCQQDFIKGYVLDGSAMCLHNDPVQQFDKPFCGDYLVNQDSEACDCGTEITCEDPCCHASNCTLIDHASCSAMDLCCDPNTCSIRASSAVCRIAVNDCDVTEYCNGTSAECPSDAFGHNGLECSVGSFVGHCFLGQCLSARQQCSMLFEDSDLDTTIEDLCWTLNTDGDEWGNCGSNLHLDYTPCSRVDQRCGKLQCSSSTLTTENEYPAALDHFLTYRADYPAFTCFSIDYWFLSIDTAHDHAYVRDGTWCNQDSFCYRKQCTHVADIPGFSQTCPYGCHENGVCDENTKICNCFDNYEGSFCATRTVLSTSESTTQVFLDPSAGSETTDTSAQYENIPIDGPNDSEERKDVVLVVGMVVGAVAFVGTVAVIGLVVTKVVSMKKESTITPII